MISFHYLWLLLLVSDGSDLVSLFEAGECNGEVGGPPFLCKAGSWGKAVDEAWLPTAAASRAAAWAGEAF